VSGILKLRPLYLSRKNKKEDPKLSYFEITKREAGYSDIVFRGFPQSLQVNTETIH
jgi:hypothetical protein